MDNTLSFKRDDGSIDWAKVGAGLTILGGLITVGVVPQRFAVPVAIASIFVALALLAA
jgi:hypothetical protein